MPEKFSNKVILFADMAGEPLQNNIIESSINKNNIVNYIAVGRLDPWRGFDILIEAFAMAIKQNNKLRLTILGKGMDKIRLTKIIRKRDIERYVDMRGSVDRGEYYRLMQQSDVVVNPSLKEGAVTVSFDSMSMGKPLICIDTTGYTRYFSQEYAIVIPECGRKQMITKLGEAIIKLENSALRNQLGKKAQQESLQFTWDKRGEQICQTILKNYK